jgi:hypothetical protein
MQIFLDVHQPLDDVFIRHAVLGFVFGGEFLPLFFEKCRSYSLELTEMQEGYWDCELYCIGFS